MGDTQYSFQAFLPIAKGPPVELPKDGELLVQVPKFRNPLIEVILEGEADVQKGCSRDLFLSPWCVSFSGVKKGKYVLELRAYGNRRNTFGQLHNCNEDVFWCGPNAWRTTGENWAYEYHLTRTGILVSPRIGIRLETISKRQRLVLCLQRKQVGHQNQRGASKIKPR